MNRNLVTGTQVKLQTGIRVRIGSVVENPGQGRLRILWELDGRVDQDVSEYKKDGKRTWIAADRVTAILPV